MYLNRKKLIYAFVLFVSFLILSFLFTYPLLKTNMVYFSDDMFFHIQRIEELTENIKNGNWFVGIYTHTFGKIGYPLNLFYPWITIVPFALLSLIFSNQVLAIYLGIAFYTFLTLLFSYITTYKFSKDRRMAYITACIYAFSSYRVIDIFTRFALGEYVALTFLPLCLYGIYAVCRGNYRDWPYLAFGCSFVLLSHLLSVLLDFILLFIVAIILLVKTDKIKERVESFIKSVLVALLSSAVFIVPFLEQWLFQKYKQPGKTDLSGESLLPTRFIAESLNNNINRIDNGNTYNLGIIILLIIIIGFIMYRSWNKSYKGIYLFGIFFTILSTSLIPWTILQKTPISYIQFPWRFLGIATLLLSIIGGKEFIQICKVNSIRNYKMFIAMLITIGIVLVPFCSSVIQLKKVMQTTPQLVTYNNKGDFIFNPSQMKNNAGLYHLDDYASKNGGVIVEQLYKHTSYINGSPYKLKIRSKDNRLTYKFHEFKGNKEIVLPQLLYKNLEVTDSYGKKLPVSTDKYNRLKIRTNQNTNGSEINVRYVMSNIDRIAILLSIGTWLISIIVLLKHLIVKLKIS